MRSRNMYLTPDRRQSALNLHKAPISGRRMAGIGEACDRSLIPSAAVKTTPIRKRESTVSPFADVGGASAVDGQVSMAMAVYVGRARLIDNMMSTP